MSRSACHRFAEARSAFVDGSIDAESRDRLLSHLGDCPACRGDVDELRRLRSLLSDPGRSGAAAPSGLTDRLVSIAGGEEQDPLWSRPFRRVDPKPLPSLRRRRRRRALVAATALGSLVVAAAGAGYLAAPPAAAAIADPTAASRSEFASALADQPLGSDPVAATTMVGQRLGTVSAETAVRATTGRDLTWSASGVPEGAATAVGSDGVIRAVSLSGTPLSTGAAVGLLARAEQAADAYGVSGTEQVVIADGATVKQAEVTVRSAPGQGSQFVVSDAGHRLGEGFVPETQQNATSLASVLAGDYRLGGVDEVPMLGRAVSVVEARRTDTDTPAARWWIDDRTGLLLGRQTYDAAGALVQSSMFSSLTSTSGGFIDHPAPRLTVPVATMTMAPANGRQLSVQGWECEDDLAGLPLTEVRTDSGSDPSLVHLVYSNGVWTVSVFEQRGRLTEMSAGSQWDAGLEVYRRAGLPQMASWQSGEVTFTVVTDGPDAMLDQAVRSLPRAGAGEPTTMSRIAAGWSRILELTVG